MQGVTRTTTIAIKILIAISLRDLFVIGKGSSSVGSATEKVKKAKQDVSKGVGNFSAGGTGRKKWKGDTCPNSNAKKLVMWFDGVPKAFCKHKDANAKECGWNTMHSTKYHAMWRRQGKAFQLSETSS